VICALFAGTVSSAKCECRMWVFALQSGQRSGIGGAGTVCFDIVGLVLLLALPPLSVDRGANF